MNVVVMKLRDYLMNVSTEELTEKLKYLDKAIQELHENGYYVVSDLADIEIIDNKITLESFKDKIDYLDSGINENGKNKNILELCSIGICAYNKLSVLHTSKDFIVYVIDNVEMFLEHGNIPSIMQEYYIDVFNRGKVDYLNSFLFKHGVNANQLREVNEGESLGTSKVLVKRNSTYNEQVEPDNIINLDDYRDVDLAKPRIEGTDIEKKLSKKDAAYASILLLPAMLALVYIFSVVIYFVFFYGG